MNRRVSTQDTIAIFSWLQEYLIGPHCCGNSLFTKKCKTKRINFCLIYLLYFSCSWTWFNIYRYSYLWVKDNISNSVTPNLHTVTTTSLTCNHGDLFLLIQSEAIQDTWNLHYVIIFLHAIAISFHAERLNTGEYCFNWLFLVNVDSHRINLIHVTLFWRVRVVSYLQLWRYINADILLRKQK